MMAIRVMDCFTLGQDCASKDEDDFEDAWMELSVDYSEYGELVNYLEKTWIKHKYSFVSYWTDTLTHFGRVNLIVKLVIY
jgi:hypothetical protein